MALEGPLFLQAWLFTLGWPASLFAVAVVHIPEAAWPPHQAQTESARARAVVPSCVTVSYFLSLAVPEGGGPGTPEVELAWEILSCQNVCVLGCGDISSAGGPVTFLQSPGMRWNF